MTVDSSDSWLVPLERALIDMHGSVPCGTILSFLEQLDAMLYYLVRHRTAREQTIVLSKFEISYWLIVSRQSWPSSLLPRWQYQNMSYQNVNDFIRSRLDLMELLSDTKLRLLKNMILNYEGKFCFRCHINYSWNIYFSFSYTSLDALLNKCRKKQKLSLIKTRSRSILCNLFLVMIIHLRKVYQLCKVLYGLQ